MKLIFLSNERQSLIFFFFRNLNHCYIISIPLWLYKQLMTSKSTHLINKKASNKNIMNSCDWFLPTKMLPIRLELNMAHPSWYCLKKLRKKKRKWKRFMSSCITHALCSLKCDVWYVHKILCLTYLHRATWK